ncbi:hypothetical protein FB558_5391 [Pseudonocardia kunmingensis]|uniref:Uncharacterized protein n=1 Tax=Pseudonocardia kunmingensis TaxID=630975 RepID=A0A543DJW5_9PSEU|nr:hypothetical protein FB558_5391 [Pseudonocardia kunmingensis]
MIGAPGLTTRCGDVLAVDDMRVGAIALRRSRDV